MQYVIQNLNFVSGITIFRKNLSLVNFPNKGELHSCAAQPTKNLYNESTYAAKKITESKLQTVIQIIQKKM